jgi:hypothetical protein
MSNNKDNNKNRSEYADLGFKAAQAINDRNRETLDKLGATFEKIGKELCSIAFSNIKDFVDVAEGGEVQAVELKKISKIKSKAVKGIKEKTNIVEKGDIIYKTSTIEYILHDKQKALEELCKLRGDYPAEKKEEKVSGTLTVLRPGRINKPIHSGLSEDKD